MLKRFTVDGYRNFPVPVTFDFSASRDYQFAENNVRLGIVTNALLIGRNASGKSNFGASLFDITLGFSKQLDFSDQEDRLYLNADCGRGTARFTYDFEFDATAMRRLLHGHGFMRVSQSMVSASLILIITREYSKKNTLIESGRMGSTLSSPTPP